MLSYRGFKDSYVHEVCQIISQTLPGIEIVLDSADSVVVGRDTQEDVRECRPYMRRMSDGKEIDLSSLLVETKAARQKAFVFDGGKINEEGLLPVIEQLKA